MNIKRIICFACGFFILFSNVQKIVTPKWRNESEAETDKIDFLYSLPKNTLDYLVVGSSPSYFGINPMLIYAETGIVGLTLGTARQSAELSYHLLVETLKTQTPRLVFWDVSSLLSNSTTVEDVTRTVDSLAMSQNKAKLILGQNKSISSLTFPILQFHSRWKELSENDFVFDNSNKYFLAGSFLMFKSNLSTQKDKQLREEIIYELQPEGTVKRLN